MSDDANTSTHMVVCTAGHIDHGKTSFVRHLTGVHLDTLPEERARGITVALGFTPLNLPNGKRIAMVDVPGHEALVRTMIAGAHGVDAALLVVSADDGVMPQTREHLAILDLLGVSQGAVILSKVDLVDEELLELAAADVEELVEGTFLQDAPVVAFSSETGAGLEDVLSTIMSMQPITREQAGAYRLPIDRTFVRDGFGVVATGTSQSGILHDGETVKILPQGQIARVRGIQVHGEDTKRAEPGQRVALNLSGIEQDDVSRGMVVTKGGVPSPHIIDVGYRHTSSEVDLEDGMAVRFLLGTSECLGRAYVADRVDGLTHGDKTFIQVRLDQPIPCLPRDHYILRRVSPVTTLGGGQVLDPWAPKMRNKDRERTGAELERLDEGDVTVWLDRAGEEGLDPSDWRRRAPHGPTPELGDRVFSQRIIARLTGVLLDALASFHQEAPLSLGAHRRELRRGRLGHLDDKVFDGLLQRMAAGGTVALEGPLVRASFFQLTLSTEQEALQQDIRRAVENTQLTGMTFPELHKAFPDPEADALTRLLVSADTLHLIASVGLIGHESLEELRRNLDDHFQGHASLSPVDFKEITALTRKTAIPLLEWLDRSGWTRRTPEARVRGPSLSKS
jgi:selenocysteine-specific elongation factor